MIFLIFSRVFDDLNEKQYIFMRQIIFNFQRHCFKLKDKHLSFISRLSLPRCNKCSPSYYDFCS